MSFRLALPEGSGRQHAPWWQRATAKETAIIAVALAALVFSALAIFDLFGPVEKSGRLYIPILLIDTTVALMCGGFLFKILRDAQRRYHRLLTRLQMIAEMNHHIRNALERIELSVYSTHDQQLMQDIHVAVSRIQWALREVLPHEDEDEPE
jgi:hypothetical protein